MKQNQTTQLTKYPELDEFAQLLKDNGFTVVLNPYKENGAYPWPTWFHFFKDGKAGYVQRNSYNMGWDFSTVHKPSRECGTGFGVLDMAELTLENANKTLERSVPLQFSRDAKYVKLYSSPEEFIEKDYSHDKYIL